MGLQKQGCGLDLAPHSWTLLRSFHHGAECVWRTRMCSLVDKVFCFLSAFVPEDWLKVSFVFWAWNLALAPLAAGLLLSHFSTHHLVSQREVFCVIQAHYVPCSVEPGTWFSTSALCAIGGALDLAPGENWHFRMTLPGDLAWAASSLLAHAGWASWKKTVVSFLLPRWTASLGEMPWLCLAEHSVGNEFYS